MEKVISMVNMKALGARLKLARLDRGWSQYELTMQTGVGNSLVQELESGRRDGVTFQVMFLLADALDVSLDDLAGRVKVS